MLRLKTRILEMANQDHLPPKSATLAKRFKKHGESIFEKVNINLLSDNDVKIEKVNNKNILVIKVPRANRHQRPVYVGQNPLIGTFRRNFEGDYHCAQDEVGRMLSDRSEEPADSQIMEGFGLDDLDEASVQQYRQRFSARSPAHPWLSEDLRGLLEKLGGWRKDRISGLEGLTLAGLLMFGKVEAIRDPRAAPRFHLDYRERLSEDPEVRWTDRLTIDGTWVANVFQFYQRVVQRLLADLKIPFRLDPDLFRTDDTIVHEAIREALVNALVHADYRGQGGIIVEKYRNRFELSNPGSLLISFEQLLRGGVSECRNKALQTMFFMIGGGEQAGSGIDKIRQGWGSQKWRWPSIQESVQPDRVCLVMPMVSLLPEESLQKLRKRFGGRFDRLEPLEVQALVTAETEGFVTNSRMREISAEHPSDVTRLLQGLVGKGFLLQDGQKRGTSYRLRPESESVRSGAGLEKGDSLQSGDSSQSAISDSSRSAAGGLESISDKELKNLRVIAAPAAMGTWLPQSETRKIILQICEGRYFTAAELGELMKRDPVSLRNRFLTPMVKEGLLRRKFPSEPNRPDQAYMTAKGKREP